MRYVLVLLGLMFANVAEAIDCKTPPDCESLGYSKENDPNCAPNGYMYCVYDTSYKKCVQHNCEGLGFTTSDKTSWCKDIVHCTDNEQYTLCNENIPPLQCDIGDVYYADGSCGKVQDYTSDKIAVGVVYWVTEDKQHGKVINLHDLGKKDTNQPFDPDDPYINSPYFYWGYHTYDVSALTNYDPSNTLTALKNRDPDLYDGKGNTDKILADKPTTCYYENDTSSYYQYCIADAAQAAHAFYPPKVNANDQKVGAGHWYLPALGELMDLYGYDNAKITDYWEVSGATGNTMRTVNATLKALKDRQVTAKELANDSYYLSSSEFDRSNSWDFHTGTGQRNWTPKSNTCGVRASLEF